MGTVHNYVTDPSLRARAAGVQSWYYRDPVGNEYLPNYFASKDTVNGGPHETGAFVASGYNTEVCTDMPGIPAGSNLTVRVQVRRQSTSVTPSVSLENFGGSVVAGPVALTSVTTSTVGYSWHEVTFTNVTADPCRLRLHGTGGHTWITRALVTEQPPPIVPSYWDGSTADSAELTYSWAGTPDQSVSLQATVEPATVVTVTDPGPQSSTVGTADELTATGSTTHASGTLTWSWGGLPPGLSATGPTVTGTPTTAGTYPVSVTATDPSGESATVEVTWTVSEAPVTPTVVTITDPPAQTRSVGTALALQLTGTTTHPSGVLTWSVDVLPAGLILSGDTITGTPTTEGTLTSVVTATDDDGSSDTAELVWTITAADGGPEPEPDPEADELAAAAAELAPRVAAHVGRAGDTDALELAEAHMPTLLLFVKSYTRGNGFLGYVPSAELAAVIVTAGARMLANPDQLAYSVGDQRVSEGFSSWTLAERFVLDGYRKRFA
jgi:Putative Ig domain